MRKQRKKTYAACAALRARRYEVLLNHCRCLDCLLSGDVVGRLGVPVRVVVRLQAVPKDRAEEAVEIKDDEEPVVAAPLEARSRETALRALCMSATEGWCRRSCCKVKSLDGGCRGGEPSREREGEEKLKRERRQSCQHSRHRGCGEQEGDGTAVRTRTHRTKAVDVSLCLAFFFFSRFTFFSAAPPKKEAAKPKGGLAPGTLTPRL